MGDFVAAEKLYDEAMGSPTGTSEEQYLADQMLDAYDEADQEALNAVTSNQTFAFLQNDVAVLARKLTAEGGTGCMRRWPRVVLLPRSPCRRCTFSLPHLCCAPDSLRQIH